MNILQPSPILLLSISAALLFTPPLLAAPSKSLIPNISETSSQSSAAGNSTPHLNLSIVEAVGVTKEASTLGLHDFGSAIKSEAGSLRFIFALRNGNAVPVTIDRIKGSCGCTTGFLLEAKQLMPWTVPPGQTVHVETRVDVSHLSPGPLDKFVTVFLQGEAWSAATLELTGVVTAPMAAEVRKATAGQSAPLFTLSGVDGHSHSLAAYQGRSVAVFFFCGCPWCVRCAQAWGALQRREEAVHKPPHVTLVVFSGDGAAAKEFARETGLNTADTVLLPDPKMLVTDAYQAEPCPRVFVIDPAGMMIYTNDHADDVARRASAQRITVRAMNALL